jgi:starch synthase (maltosyl-transferring)
VSRDFEREGSIREWISRLNQARREHPALWHYKNLRFHQADNERVIFYSKIHETSAVLVAVSLDPYAPQDAIIHLPLELLGIPPEETYQVHELLSDTQALWQGPTALVQLTPQKPAAMYALHRFQRSEQGFDYYF